MFTRTLFALALFIASPAMADDDLSTYTPVMNVVPGTSYIRLYSLEGSDATFQLRAFGNKTGRELPAQSVVVPANAVKQQFMPPSMRASSPEDEAVTVYVKGSRAGLDLAGVFQHVKFNGATGEFENMSVCSLNPAFVSSFSYINSVMLDVHTSVIPGYTSYVSIVNQDSKTSHTYNLTVKDSGTGLLLGNAQVTVAAGATYKQSFAEIAKLIGFVPAADQPHVSIQVISTDGGPSVLTSHTVVNDATGTEINMSTVCPIYPTAAVSVGSGSGSGFGSADVCNPKDSPTTLHSEFVAGMTSCGIQDWSADRTTQGRICVDCGADGFINQPNDVDWWKVNLVKGSTYIIGLRGQQNNGITNGTPILAGSVVVRNPAGIPIPGASASANNKTDKNAHGLPVFTYVQYTATETGTFYVEVSDPDLTERGSYQISVQGLLSLNYSS